MQRRRWRRHQIQQGHNDRNGNEHQQKQPGAPAHDARAMILHASTARPLSANRPRGRFWMKRMINTRIAILASTAPANGSRNLLAMPSENAPTSVPHRLPTPPNTTTMKLSMM